MRETAETRLSGLRKVHFDVKSVTPCATLSQNSPKRFDILNMKKTYHLCLSAGEEVLFRDVEDYNRGFNCFALALYNTDSNGLVESEMSTHYHQLIQSGNPDEFMHYFRLSYSMYFNRKYHRSGKLGEKHHYATDIVGYNHIIAAMSYVLRTALHHGVVPIPYAYPYSSVNSIFMKEMGKAHSGGILDRRYYHRFISRASRIPDNYEMSESGVFLRESVLDIPQVENLFVTPRSFNWHMTRKSSEEWEAEQGKDNNGLPPINLSVIENGINMTSPTQMLMNEAGKSNYRKLSDMDICAEIDNNILPKYGKVSVYLLTRQEKQQIAQQLYRTLHISESQIRRCLVM